MGLSPFAFHFTLTTIDNAQEIVTKYVASDDVEGNGPRSRGGRIPSRCYAPFQTTNESLPSQRHASGWPQRLPSHDEAFYHRSAEHCCRYHRDRAAVHCHR